MHRWAARRYLSSIYGRDLKNRLIALFAENTLLKERISKIERMLPEIDLAIRLLRESIEEAEKKGKGKAG